MQRNQKKILIAVDGSDPSMEAVRYVAALMRQRNIEVTLFHVLSRMPESYYDLELSSAWHRKLEAVKQWDMQNQRNMRTFMEAARQVLLSAGMAEHAIETRIQERNEGVARDIVQESEKGYSAVVVGRTGKSALKDLVLGSIASKLIGKLEHIPVWVVGGNANPNRVLVGLDASESALAAVNYVGQMLGQADVEVHLLHVARSIDVILQRFDGILTCESADEWLRETHKHMAPIFEDAKNRLTKAGISADRISTEFITGEKSRAWVLTEQAEDRGFGTLVVGRRGLSKVDEFFLGRVSNKLVQLTRHETVWVVA